MTDRSSGDADHTECAVCGYEPDPDMVPPHYVLSLSDEDTDDGFVQSYPFGASLSVPFACSDECWLDAQDDPDLIADGGREQSVGGTERSVDELLAVEYITVDELRKLRPRSKPLPPEHELDDAECHNCGEPWNGGEYWDDRHLHGGPSLGEDWKYQCPNCGFETFEVGT